MIMIMIKLLKFLMPVNDREADQAIDVIKSMRLSEALKLASATAVLITLVPLLLALLPIGDGLA